MEYMSTWDPLTCTLSTGGGSIPLVLAQIEIAKAEPQRIQGVASEEVVPDDSVCYRKKWQTDSLEESLNLCPPKLLLRLF